MVDLMEALVSSTPAGSLPSKRETKPMTTRADTPAKSAEKSDKSGDNDEFLPARPAPWVQNVFRALLPVILPRLGVVSVDYEADDLARLKAMDGKSVLLLPNHPTNTEPALLFHLSKTINRPFYYLACREAFDHWGGWWGKIIQRVGAFSVVRGTADRASFRATRDLLALPGTRVVIFPEGEVYSQNDSLLPFHTGVFQLAFWAMDDKKKAGYNDGDAADLLLVPVALKYHYVRDMSGPIAHSLLKLEKFTGVPPAPSDAPYDRLRRVGVAILRSLEREYRLPSPKEEGEADDVSPRLDAIKEAILQRVALAAGVPVPKGDTLPEKMRGLLHTIDLVERDAPKDGETGYDKSLRNAQRLRAQPLLRDMERLTNWIAVYDGYIRADPTPERMAETLIRLERECWGKAELTGPKACRVRVGDPLNVRDCLPAYEESKRAEVARVTHEMEKRVGDLLRSEARH